MPNEPRASSLSSTASSPTKNIVSSSTLLGSASTNALDALAATTRPVPASLAPSRWRPSHVLYGGAHLFRSDGAAKMTTLAEKTLAEVVPDALTLSVVFGLDRAVAHDVTSRLAPMVARGVDDVRIDFEDGFGPRSDDDEDAFAIAAAIAVVDGATAGALPRRIGIRPKGFAEGTRARSLRTLDRFFSTVRDRGALPEGFVVTLPKITAPAEVTAMTAVLSDVERGLGLREGAIELELMIEHPRALVDDDGRAAVRALVDAGQGRVESVHLGAFDLLGALDVPARASNLSHPLCRWVRGHLKLSLYGTGVDVVDGATTLLPVGPHRAKQDAPLSDRARNENRVAVTHALAAHFHNVTASLDDGVGRGWDLHPGQMVARRAAEAVFARQGLSETLSRLTKFLDEAATAVRQGAVFDDAASAIGLVNTLVGGVKSGAIDASETDALKIPFDMLARRDFAEMIAHRLR